MVEFRFPPATRLSLASRKVRASGVCDRRSSPDRCGSMNSDEGFGNMSVEVLKYRAEELGFDLVGGGIRVRVLNVATFLKIFLRKV